VQALAAAEAASRQAMDAAVDRYLISAERRGRRARKAGV
jgi:hypothetical protein